MGGMASNLTFNIDFSGIKIEINTNRIAETKSTDPNISMNSIFCGHSNAI
jgi:hypothetical protein